MNSPTETPPNPKLLEEIMVIREELVVMKSEYSNPQFIIETTRDVFGDLIREKGEMITVEDIRRRINPILSLIEKLYGYEVSTEEMGKAPESEYYKGINPLLQLMGEETLPRQSQVLSHSMVVESREGIEL